MTKPAKPALPELPCPFCKVKMQTIGQVPVRVGGLAGGWGLLFGSMSDVGEATWGLDVYRCTQCKRMEFYDHDLSLPKQWS